MKKMMTLGGMAGFALAMLVGCGDDAVDVDPSGGGGQGGAGVVSVSSSGTGGAPTPTVNLELRVSVVGGDGIAGATVCLLDSDFCLTTDGQGIVFFPVPQDDDELAFTVEHPSLQPMVFPRVNQRRPWTYQLNGLTRAQASLLGVMDDGGAYLVHAVGAPGATVSSAPGSPAGPVYGTLDGPDPEATAIVDGENAGYAYLDLDPGEVTVVVHGSPGACKLTEQWTGDEPNSIRAPLVAGFLTVPMPMDCNGGEQ